VVNGSKKTGASFCTNCGTPLDSSSSQVMPTVHGGSLAKIVVNLPGQESREEFLSKPETTIGRSKRAMIQVLFPTVSGIHAQLTLTRNGHTLTDLNSTNGTFVNGQRLQAGTNQQLRSHDIIRFSDSLGNSASLTYFAPSGFSDVGEVDIRQLFTITQDTAYIGRNAEAAILLEHPAVSWYHSKLIRRDSNNYAIQDLSSNNGTFLNGVQLRDKAVSLTRGDVIQIGPFNLVYQDAGQFVPFSAERNFRLEAAGLIKSYYRHNLLGRPKLNQGKTILNGIDLVINPREFVALVGGSGTGKSTLLKALSGVSPATAGAILVNGDDLYTNFNLYRTMMGYVPQDDIIHGGLIVRQALQYAAQLRLPDADHTDIQARIDNVLDRVGMTAHADTTIRDLSGGQRKRVSIAVELLAEPWIFFLDEPTSGLDPGLEKLMMDTLRQLADEGRTIVLVTHATNNIMSNCDQVAFLAQGGRLAYFGPPNQASQFFGVDDFADIYTHLSQTISSETPVVPPQIATEYQQAIAGNEQTNMPAGPLWAAHYQQSDIHHTYVANRQSGELARPMTGSAASAQVGLSEQWQQFMILARRYVDLIRNDRYSLTVLLAVMPIIGVLLLLISNGSALVGNSAAEVAAILEADGFYSVANQAQTMLFMMALAANLLGVFAASFEIINEEPIYRRERMINLKLLPYFGSKFAVLGTFSLLQCFLLLLVLAFGISFPGGGALVWAPLEYYFTLVFTALASVALGLFISAVASSTGTVIYLMLLTIFVQIVFSGAIFDLPAIVQPLSWLTITRWSLESLGTSTGMEALNNLGQIRVERDVEMQRGMQTVVQDIPTTATFYVNYASGVVGLLSRWIFLWVHTILWSGLAIWSIKRKDNF
jgi:ABC-type multidrug transport system ATPase subunit/pSer/pThr/pTyr-binding forkhead associated (FHA) protein